MVPPGLIWHFLRFQTVAHLVSRAASGSRGLSLGLTLHQLLRAGDERAGQRPPSRGVKIPLVPELHHSPLPPALLPTFLSPALSPEGSPAPPSRPLASRWLWL